MASTARTVTAAARRVIRLAGLADYVSGVSTMDNGNGTFRTMVETIYGKANVVVDALVAEGFVNIGKVSDGASFSSGTHV
jgi:hypothetical protein